MNPNDDASIAPRPSSERPEALSDRVRSLRLPGNARSARSNRLPWVLCIILLCSTVAFGLQSYKRSQLSNKDDDKKPAVDGATADSGGIVLQAKGYIIPAHTNLVNPLVSGKVEALYIEEGQRVEKGQILAQLEIVEYEAKYKRARSKFEEAVKTLELTEETRKVEILQAEIEIARSETEKAKVKDKYDRARRLRDTPPEELEQHRNDLKLADEFINLRKASLRLAKEVGELKIKVSQSSREAADADLVEARWRLDSCTLLAPVTGTILTKDAEVNNLVNPVAMNVSAKVCSLADLSDLEVDLSIQERDIQVIHVGQRCTVMPEAFQNNEKYKTLHPEGYAGVVSRLMPIADRAKGAIPVRVKVQVPREEEGVYLKPDMGVIVSFKK